MGDACGIGPEIVAKLFAGRAAGCVVVGDVGRHAPCRAVVTGGLLPVARLETAGRRWQTCRRDCMPVLQVDGLPPDLLAARSAASMPAPARAAAAASSARSAWSQAGEAAAIVTAPIHKEALAAAGIAYPGHTEMLQALAAATAGRRRCA